MATFSEIHNLAQMAQKMPWEDQVPGCAVSKFKSSVDASMVDAMCSLVNRVANLNRDAGEIGAGMLASLVDDARKIIG